MSIALGVEIGLFVVGIVAAIFLIPREIKRLERKKNGELIKALLKEWGEDCGRAIVLAMPMAVRSKWLRVKDDGGIVESKDGFTVYEIISQVWAGIREGERDPNGSGTLVKRAVYEVMYSDEEKEGKKILVDSDLEYVIKDIWGRERELPKAFVSKMLNTIYAKLEILELKNLPIKELEGAREHLDFFEEKQKIIRSQLILYTNKVADSMEKFGIYLWELEEWSKK
jgi:hypothetical protein